MSPNTDAHDDDQDDTDCDEGNRHLGPGNEGREESGDRQRRRGKDCDGKNRRRGTGNGESQQQKGNCNGERNRRRGKGAGKQRRNNGNCDGNGRRSKDGGGNGQQRHGKGDGTGTHRGGQGCREGESRRQRRRRRGRERDENGRFADSVTGEDVLAVFEAVDGPVVTSTDVADVLGLSTESARQHLNELVGEGPLRRRKTGRTIVYWVAETPAEP